MYVPNMQKKNKLAIQTNCELERYDTMKSKEYYANIYLKNEKDLQTYLKKLIDEKGKGEITIEEAMQFNFEWGSQQITN